MVHRSVDLPQTPSEIPRAAYVHIPFCRHRCGYCNFTLIANRDDLIEKYFDALDTELRSFGNCRPVDTLFIGGGTPTYPSPDKLKQLLDLVNDWFSLNSGGEYSVEANPCDITESKVAILSAAGVTRVSLGAQSFNQKKLRVLDRSHTETDIVNAVTLLRKYHLHVSIDLIFGAPDETLDVWETDLEKAIQLAPDHLSTYGLTYEKGTYFYSQMLHGTLAPLADDLELNMYQHGIETLEQAGFEHYEISNFSRPGYRCRHNEGYWKLRGHFAVGAGASRFVCGTRETNHRSTTTYMKRLLAGESPVAFREHLSAEASAREAVVFGLRQIDGIAISDFYESTGFDIFKLLKTPLDRFIYQGFLSLEDNQLRLTRKGLYISDSLWPDFLIE
ncbi:MAG: radical SAM family heme chaperone HemW [Planctomycetota bacterium]|nr:radical SAM family heme chaperone HemW [Planctomycetota bacterium]